MTAERFPAGDALVFADTATLLLLDTQDQATGMLTEQLAVGIAEAFSRLRAYAYANDLRLTKVARDIVARRLRLQPDPGSPEEGDA